MTKQQYLELAANWKAEYAAHTIQSRLDKHDYKEAQRDFAKCGSYDNSAGYSSESNTAFRKAERVMHDAMAKCQKNREDATSLIETRHEMKVEAGKAMAADRLAQS